MVAMVLKDDQSFFLPQTDNCQGVCLLHKLVPKSSTPSRTTITTSTAEMKTSTAYHHTDVSGLILYAATGDKPYFPFD